MNFIFDTKYNLIMYSDEKCYHIKEIPVKNKICSTQFEFLKIKILDYKKIQSDGFKVGLTFTSKKSMKYKKRRIKSHEMLHRRKSR